MRQYWRVLRADLKIALGPKFFLAVLLIPPFILLDAIIDLPYALSDSSYLSVWYFYFNSIAFGGVYGRYLLGMLCALPYAASFCAEYQMDMTPQVMVRGGTRNYFLSKFAAAAFAGGLTNFLGQMFFVMALSSRIPLFLSDDFATMGDFYYMPIAAHNPIAYFAIALYYAFLNGMLLAGLSMWISGFIQSRYAVYTVPAIAVFLQIQIARILKLPFEWRLDMWLSMRGIIREEQTTIWAAFVVVVSILAVCAWSFLKKGKKVIDYA